MRSSRPFLRQGNSPRAFPFAEEDFALWFDLLEERLTTLPAWRDLIVYRGISVMDAGRLPLYFGFLNALREAQSRVDVEVSDYAGQRYAGRENWGVRAQRVWRRLRTGEMSFVQGMRILSERFGYRLRMSLPPQRLPPMADARRALVVRAFSDMTAFPVLQPLKDDLGWEVLFASWNRRLEKPVRQAGIRYVHLEDLYRSRYLSLLSNHERQVARMLARLDAQEPAAVLTEMSDIPLQYNTYSLFHEVCVQVRTYTDIYFDLLTRSCPDVVVLFNDISPPGRTMAKVSAMAQVPSVTIQHGLFAGHLYRRLVTDRLLVWGSLPRDFWLERGCSPEQVKIVGAIGHENWITLQKGDVPNASNRARPTVLFAGQFPGTFLSARQHQGTIEAVMHAALQLPHVDFVVKSHPGESPETYQAAIDSSGLGNVVLISYGPIEPLLRECDLVITIFSTTGVEAMLLGRPVLVLSLSPEPPLAPYASAASLVTQADRLAEAILRILEDQAFRQTLIESGRQFAQDYLGPMDSAALRAAESIVKLVESPSGEWLLTMSIRRAGQIAHLEMPAWLRGSPLEQPARSLARRIKSVSSDIERTLRRGKVWCQLPSINRGVWLDYDFAIRHTLPEEDALLAALTAWLKPGQGFYDIGGFVGWYAIAAAQSVGPQGQVVTFEPVPETAKLLRRHLELNRGVDRVRVIEAACSSAFGFASMPVWPINSTTWASGNALFNVLPQTDMQPDHIPVSLIRLDDFWAAGGPLPNAIKIDVEGAELWVLEGAQKLLTTARPMIFLEIHGFAWELFNTTEENLRHFLDSVSYDILDVAPPHCPLPVIPERGYAILQPRELR